MKNIFNREWLENYKTIPKRDNTIYKNYQNPGMTNWDRQFGSLSPTQKGRYQGFLNTIPDELKGLSAAEMQKYLQGVDEKQAALAQERAGYDAQIQNIRNQQAQKNAKPQMSQWKQDRLLNQKYSPQLAGWGHGANEFGNGILGKPYHLEYFKRIGPAIRNEMNKGLSYKDAYYRVISSSDYNNTSNPWWGSYRGPHDPVFPINTFLSPGTHGDRNGEEAYNFAMKRLSHTF